MRIESKSTDNDGKKSAGLGAVNYPESAATLDSQRKERRYPIRFQVIGVNYFKSYIL